MATTLPSELSKQNENYYAALSNQNANIQTEIDSLVDNSSMSSRLNTYLAEDRAFISYLNKFMILIYVFVYFLLLLTLYLNRSNTSTFTIIGIALTFIILPFAINILSKYMYRTFLKIMHLIYKGNSVYLYNPPEKINSL